MIARINLAAIERFSFCLMIIGAVSIVLGIAGCGGGAQTQEANPQITYCLDSDQILALDSDGNIISTRPITEAQPATTEEGRAFYRYEGLVLLGCGANATLHDESSIDSSVHTSENNGNGQ